MNIQRITFDEPHSLELGGVLKRPTLAYSTYGQLNKEKDNVTLVCHALTASSEVEEWWKDLFGKDKVFDPERDFIICINNLCSPYGSSSPKSRDIDGQRYGLDFPDTTLRDTVTLHLRILEYLEISNIRLLIGGSCGGNIALEMAVILGSKVQYLVAMCCSAYETPWVIGIHESQRIILRSDPTLFDNIDGAGQEGLRGARASALLFYRSHPSFEIRQSEDNFEKVNDFRASSYIRYQGKKFINRYDAQCYFKQLSALDTHHMARDRGSLEKALSKITARTLVIGFDTDLLIPVIEQQKLAKYIPQATCSIVVTPYGHDAFLIETDTVQKVIDKWLSKFATV